MPQGILARMNAPPSQAGHGLSQSEREEFLESLLAEEPELTFTPRGNPDLRLVKLARLLGERAARKNFEAQMSKQEPGAS
jgi:hypothetical protein